MYSKVGAKDADLLVIGKKRISRKRKFFICVLFVATVLSGMSVIEKLNAPAPTPVDTSINIVTTMPKPESGTPKDHSAYENFCIAAGIINSSSYFEASTAGTIVASVFGAPYNQSLTGYRVQKDGRLFHEINSTSTMKSVGEQRFFAQDTILMRTAKYKKGEPVWGGIGLVQTDDFSAKYGLIPREICLYVINENSVVDSGFTEEVDGKSTYWLQLDPDTAPERYKRQVGALGGANEYPVFESIKLSFTIDENWVIQSHTVEETYDITIAGLGSMTCRANMTETFTNIGADLDFPPQAQDFLTLAPDDVGELDPTPVMTAADYLAEAFGDYLGGSTIEFSADVDALGSKLPLKGYLDIANLDIRVGIGDLLYAAYKDDCVYVKSGDGKVKIPVSSLTTVMEELKPLLKNTGIDFDEISSLLEGDIIGTLFADSDIIEDGNDVHILMPFSLMNIGFDIDMHLKKGEQKFYPHSIKATLDLKELGLDKLIETENGEYKISVDLNFGKTDLPAPDESYPEFDASFIKEFISPVKNMISAKAYKLSGGVNINGTEIGITADVVRGENITAAAQIKIMGITAEIKFVDNAVYIATGNIKLKADISDLPTLVNEIFGFIPNADEITAAITNALGSLKNVSVESVLETALKFLPTIVFENNTLKLDISGVKADVKIESDTEISLALPEFTVKETTVSANLGIGAVLNETPDVTVENAASYVSVADLIPYLAPVKSLMKAKSLGATVNGSIGGLDQKNPEKTVTLSGGMTLNLYDGEKRALSAKAEFEALSQKIALTLAKNKAYIAVNDGIKLSLDIDKNSLSELINAVNTALPQDKKLGDANITSALKIADDILSLDLKSLFALVEIDENTLPKVMGYILSLEYKGDALILTLSVNDVTVTVSLKKPENDKSLTATVGINFTPASKDGEEPKAPVNAQITLTLGDFSDTVADIAAEDPESYVSSETLCSLVSPVVNVAFASSYNLRGSVTVNNTNIELTNAQIVRGESLTAAAQIRVTGITVDVKFVDNVVYIATGNIKLKAAISDMPALIDAITPLIPNSGELLGKVNGLIEQVKNIDLLEAVKSLAISETQDGGLRIAYGTIVAEIKAANDKELSLNIPDLSVKIGETTDENGDKTDKLLKLSANASLTAIREQTAPVTVENAGSYVSVTDVLPYIDPVLKLMRSESFKANLNGTIESNDIKKYLDSTAVSGDLAVNIGKESGGLSLQAALIAFGHKLDLAFTGDTAYVSVNDNINLSLNTNNLSDILSNINEALPDGKKVDIAKTNDYINKITNLDLSSLIKFDEKTIASVLGCIRALEYKDDSLIITLSFKDITVTASIVSPSGNTDGADSLFVNLGINYAPEAKPNEKAKDPLNINLALTLSDFSDERIDISVTNPEKYVTSKALSDFIKPVINTIQQEKFDISFSVSIDGTDANNNPENTKISGELKVIPTSEITNASFPEMYLALNLGNGANPAQHAVKLLIEKTADTGEIEIYANYNGMKIHLGYTAALKIVGAVCDMLNIDIPMINNLTSGVYTKGELETDIFDDATIAGLTEKIEDLNGIFAVADGGESAFDELINKVLYNALDEALKGVKLSMQEGELEISVRNSLLERIMDIVNGNDKTETSAVKKDLGEAVISLKHDDTLLSTLDISNLAVNGKTVSMSAALIDSTNMTLPKNTDADFDGAMDFDSIYDLLASVINTANTRYFPISGEIKLGGIANATIFFDLNVAITDKADGGTKVLVGMKTYSNLKPISLTGIAIDKADSYLYFDGEKLYVQRDDYKSSWGKWKYDRTTRYSLAAEEFADYATDVIFDLIPLTDFVKNQIPTESTGGSAIKIENILKKYAYTQNDSKNGGNPSFNLTLAISELAGTSSSLLGDLDLTLVAKTIDGKNYLQSFNSGKDDNGNLKSMSIAAGVLKASFDAKLKSVDESNLNRGLDLIEFGHDNGSGNNTLFVPYTELENTLSSIAWKKIQEVHQK